MGAGLFLGMAKKNKQIQKPASFMQMERLFFEIQPMPGDDVVHALM